EIAIFPHEEGQARADLQPAFLEPCACDHAHLMSLELCSERRPWLRQIRLTSAYERIVGRCKARPASNLAFAPAAVGNRPKPQSRKSSGLERDARAELVAFAFLGHLAPGAVHLMAVPLRLAGAGQDARQGVVALVAGVFVERLTAALEHHLARHRGLIGLR